MKTTIFTFLFTIISFLLNAQKLETNKRIDADSMRIDFINPFYAPIQLTLESKPSFKNTIRIKKYALLNYNDTLKNSIAIPLRLISNSAKVDVSKYITIKGSFGDPKKKIDSNYKYHLPYQKNRSYKLIQGFGGRFSHRDINSKFALDFGLKIGDTITAARSGIVFYLKENSDEYCNSKKCNDKANNILILHDDGTIAHYVHLNFNGVLVNVGEKVSTGQPIGISGMTGFTTIPHLHFAVLKAGNISIPFRFKGQKSETLKQGWSYKKKH